MAARQDKTVYSASDLDQRTPSERPVNFKADSGQRELTALTCGHVHQYNNMSFIDHWEVERIKNTAPRKQPPGTCAGNYLERFSRPRKSR